MNKTTKTSREGLTAIIYVGDRVKFKEIWHDDIKCYSNAEGIVTRVERVWTDTEKGERYNPYEYRVRFGDSDYRFYEAWFRREELLKVM